MRHLAFKPRQTGRTTILAHEIMNDLAYHDKQVYVVAQSFHIAMIVRDIIKSYSEEFANRVRTLSIHSLHTLRGADPRNIYFEHTSYEQATADQLKEIYRFEDMKARLIWGVP